MKIIILGNGFVASHLSYQTIPDRLEANDNQIINILEKYKPDCIINAIGVCGKPNIDYCETHQEETALANTVLPIMLADACAKKSIRLIHIGSGCIYFGQSPNYYLEREGDPHYGEDKVKRVDSGWKETDFANPQSYYSKTKYAADLAIGDMSHVTTLRIRMPISEQDVPRNLINKLKNYTQLINIPNSVTFMTDFVRCVEWVIKEHKTGIFHVVNPVPSWDNGPLTAVRIMREYQKYVPDHNFSIISEAQLDQLTLAKRSNCILNTDKLRLAGFHVTPAEDALKHCMKNYFNR